MHEAGERVRVRMLMLGKASVAHVKIKAFGAAMAHAGDILLEAMIASHSNMNQFSGLEVFAGEDVYAGLRPESLLNILAIAPFDKYLYPGLRPEVLWLETFLRGPLGPF